MKKWFVNLQASSNWLTRWFCGHAAECDVAAGDGDGDGDDAAAARRRLARADANARERFLLVGLMSNLSATQQLLTRLLPHVFSEVNSAHARARARRTRHTFPGRKNDATRWLLRMRRARRGREVALSNSAELD